MLLADPRDDGLLQTMLFRVTLPIIGRGDVAHRQPENFLHRPLILRLISQLPNPAGAGSSRRISAKSSEIASRALAYAPPGDIPDCGSSAST